MIRRPDYVNAILPFVDAPLVKTLSGVRRCGKSTILEMMKEEFLNRNEGLKSMYKADDDNMAVLYITNGTARFCSFAGPERKVRF